MARERSCWLFKTEPTCFSFEDLRNRPNGTEHWDGVRNFQARNFLRDAVQPGDGVLVYHSNCANPAVMGTARVVRGGYADWTAFDPAGERFDPRSLPGKPVWYMVDVQYDRPFVRPVTLVEIKRHPALAGMELVRRSRLSIQPVSADAWRTILLLGGLSDD